MQTRRTIRPGVGDARFRLGINARDIVSGPIFYAQGINIEPIAWPQFRLTRRSAR
jgi:hypothetical protein